jgi:hypothetical protein
MSPAQQTRPVRTKTTENRRRPSLEKQLAVVFGVALLGAAATAAVLSFEHLFGPPPEQLVTIHRTHGCNCAFTLVSSLRAAGFEVRVIEHQTLKTVRAALRTPANLRGCHVGAYLDYFLEGHVSPAALSVLATQRPHGLGLATESSANVDPSHVSIALDERSPVVLIGLDGIAQPWFQAPSKAGR